MGVPTKQKLRLVVLSIGPPFVAEIKTGNWTRFCRFWENRLKSKTQNSSAVYVPVVVECMKVGDAWIAPVWIIHHKLYFEKYYYLGITPRCSNQEGTLDSSAIFLSRTSIRFSTETGRRYYNESNTFYKFYSLIFSRFCRLINL